MLRRRQRARRKSPAAPMILGAAVFAAVFPGLGHRHAACPDDGSDAGRSGDGSAHHALDDASGAGRNGTLGLGAILERSEPDPLGPRMARVQDRPRRRCQHRRALEGKRPDLHARARRLCGACELRPCRHRQAGDGERRSACREVLRSPPERCGLRRQSAISRLRAPRSTSRSSCPRRAIRKAISSRAASIRARRCACPRASIISSRPMATRTPRCAPTSRSRAAS